MFSGARRQASRILFFSRLAFKIPTLFRIRQSLYSRTQYSKFMYFSTSHLHHLPPTPPPEPPLTCVQGHSSTLIIPTDEGGSICLLCLSNLISNPRSPTVHVSYALSQLSIALSQPSFRQSFFTFHSHFLISPLVGVLSSFDDESIAKQTTDLIIHQLCEAPDCNVHAEFVTRLVDRLSSGSLAWSQRQLYTVTCHLS